MNQATSPDFSKFDELSKGWLDRYNGHTRAAAEKEIRRFVLWCAGHATDPLTVSSAAAQAYLDFLVDPQPADVWVGPAVPRLLPDGGVNPRWRPFAGPLSPSSIRLARTHLKGLYGVLQAEGHSPRNPFHVTRLKTEVKTREESTGKALSPEAVSHLMRFLNALPGHEPRMARKKALYTLLIQVFLLTGVRRFESWSLMREDIYEAKDGLWLRVRGKGRVVADIPLPAELLQTLDRYDVARALLGHPALSTGPLFPVKDGQARSSSGMYRLVKRIFRLAAENAHPEIAEQLLSATPHWLRHTYAQHLVDNGAPLDVVRDNLRHANIATTSKYLRGTRRRRQTETLPRVATLWPETDKPGVAEPT